MADPVDFDLRNAVLGPPDGMEDEVQNLSVWRDGEKCISCWRLTPEELEEVNRTGVVWLSVWAGPTQPPVLVSGEALVVRHYDA